MKSFLRFTATRDKLKAQFKGIHIHTLTVKIQEYANKCTKLQHKVFTTKTIGLRHVSTPYCRSSPLPEDDRQESVKTCWCPSILIIQTLYCNSTFVGIFLHLNTMFHLYRTVSNFNCCHMTNDCLCNHVLLYHDLFHIQMSYDRVTNQWNICMYVSTTICFSYI